MADTGWLSPGTLENDTSYGDPQAPWLNPSNAATEDGTNADCEEINSLNTPSNYLKATNFGASIPAGSTIDGIEVRYKAQSHLLDGWIVAKLDRLRLVIGGTVQTVDRSDGQAWPRTLTMYTLGGPTDTWDGPSRDDVVASDFGVVLSCAYDSGSGGFGTGVDVIQIKIYYTEGGGGINYDRTLSDAVSVNDLTDTSRQRNRFIAEQLSLVDALIRAISGGAIITRTLADSVEITDLSGGLGFIAYGRVLSDAVPVSETLARREALLFRLLQDDVTAYEAISSVLSASTVVVRMLVDSVDVFDGLLRTAELFRKVEELVDTEDQLLRYKEVNRQLLDSIAVSAATMRAVLHGRVVSESVDLYEAVFREVWLRRVLTDAVDASDLLSITLTHASQAIGFILMQLHERGIMELRRA